MPLLTHRGEAKLRKENLMLPSCRICILTASLAGAVLFVPVASAQDAEPNDTCTTAQDAGALVLPSVVSGSIDGSAPTPPSDVDFYRFTATPGQRLRISGSVGSRAGAFSDTCALLAAPDTGVETDADFTVPASGAFVLAVAETFDESFNGGFGQPNSGPYTVSIAPAPAPIGSISGRLIDAVTRRPLAGAIILRRCTQGLCSESVTLQNTEEVADGTGVFRIQTGALGQPILVGDFELTAFAEMGQFDDATRRFSVGAGQNLDLGNVGLTPPPISLQNIRPCTRVPAQGGTCQYSVNVRNNMPTRLTGQAFSTVTAGPAQPDLGFAGTSFEASTQRIAGVAFRGPISMPGGGASRDVTFYFKVPPSVPEGTMICSDVKIGLDPAPLFNVQRQWLLFCLTREASGYRAMGSEESRAAFERMRIMEGPAGRLR
jgi:hypothetical protein